MTPTTAAVRGTGPLLVRRFLTDYARHRVNLLMLILAAHPVRRLPGRPWQAAPTSRPPARCVARSVWPEAPVVAAVPAQLVQHLQAGRSVVLDHGLWLRSERNAWTKPLAKPADIRFPRPSLQEATPDLQPVRASSGPSKSAPRVGRRSGGRPRFAQQA